MTWKSEEFWRATEHAEHSAILNQQFTENLEKLRL